MQIILAALIFYDCTAKRSALRTEEFIVREQGRIPFLLEFPVDIDVDDNTIASIEKKEHKTDKELWSLVRFYHLISDKRNNLVIAEYLYREISDREKKYRFINQFYECLRAWF